MATLSVPEEAARRLARRKLAARCPPPQWPTLNPENEALRERCRWDYALFARHFFPHICTDDFAPVHLEYYQDQAVRQGSRGHRDVCAAPRGFSKTSGCAAIGILHDCAYHSEQFILYLTNSHSNAELKVRDLRDELTDNAAFLRVYGAQAGSVWNQGYFTTRYGVTVMAAGRFTQVRGLSRRFVRFSKIVCDDIEHPEQVLMQDQRFKTHQWLHNDVFKLGYPRTNIEVWGTILHSESELAGLLTTPGWQRRTYRSVQRFADVSAMPLWQQWRELFIDLGNPQAAQDARAFFEAHRDAMLAGTQVLWPGRKSYYALMVDRLVEGETSFWQELQNEPHGDARLLFHMDRAAYCTLVPDGLLRADGTSVAWTDIVEVVAFWDPTPDKAEVRGSDFASCAVVLRDRAGYCYAVDAYLAQEHETSKQIAGIVDLLWRWQVPIIGLEANGFQSLLASDLRAAIAQHAHEAGIPWQIELWPVKNLKNKILRIKSLEPLVANGWLQFARTLPIEALRQFADFLPVPGAGKVDYPDSLEGALRVTKRLLDRRSVA